MTSEQAIDIRAFTGAEMLEDRVTADRLLLGAPALAAVTDQPLVEVAGRQAVLLHNKMAIRLDAAPLGLGDGDQVVALVHVGEGEGLNLSLRFDTAEWTTGFPEPDYLINSGLVGVSERLPRYGWVEAIFPMEGCKLYGRTPDWAHAVTVTLTSQTDGRSIALAELRLQRRERLPGPRLTDRGLLEQLDLDVPGLAPARAAYQGGDPAAALRAVIAYYRNRQHPRCPFTPQPPDPAFDTREADLICDDMLNGFRLPHPMDWRFNPDGNHWTRMAFHRLAFLHTLLAAWQATGRAKYARKIEYFIRSWIRDNPTHTGFAYDNSPAWSTLEVAVRMGHRVWTPFFFQLMECPDVSDDTRILMLKSMFEHAEFLLQRNILFRSNWLVFEAGTITTLGLLYPEFRRAADWRAEGWRRLTDEIVYQFYPDGMHYELTTHYHIATMKGFRHPFWLAQVNDVPVSPAYEARMLKAYEFIAAAVRPDLVLPPTNDSQIVSLAQPAKDGCVEWMQTALDFFPRDDFRWLATGRREGTPPTAGSVAFEDAGVYVMRSGWDVHDRYLFFDGGALGKQHSHEDKLSFELYALGELLILDPGIRDYMPHPWTTYYRSTAAHNTLLLDGQGQCRAERDTLDEKIRSARGDNTWHTGETADFVEAAYRSGYAEIDGPFVHRRAILFVKPDYWVIFDEMAGEGEHVVDALYHFRPMRVMVDAAPRRFRANRDRAKLDLLLWPQCPPVEMRVVTGQMEPVQGWAAVGGDDIPIPTGIIRAAGRLPIRLATVLAPYDSGVESGLTLEALPAPDDAWACRVTRPDGSTDEITYRWHNDAEPAVLLSKGNTGETTAIRRRNAER